MEELGLAQAISVLEVANFGPFRVSDLAGDSLFERENAKIAPGIAALYEGTKPATQRHRETCMTKPTRSMRISPSPRLREQGRLPSDCLHSDFVRVFQGEGQPQAPPARVSTR